MQTQNKILFQKSKYHIYVCTHTQIYLTKGIWDVSMLRAFPIHLSFCDIL